jgi:hypothetical protein
MKTKMRRDILNRSGFYFQKLQPAQESKTGFQNVFDFPDFIEMRPLLREAVRTIARDNFKQPVLPVKIEHAATALEEQLERQTRKYNRQLCVYSNQKDEWHKLTRLYTHVLQVISQRSEIDEEIEDIIYAINQTRLSLLQLPEKTGKGKLYADEHDCELIPGTYYYYIAHELVRPYLINASQKMVPQNVTRPGRDLVRRLTTYAYRDWDTYLVHEYDEQHIVKNEKGLTNKEYYQKLENIELKYADRHYAEVLADTFEEFTELLVPKFLKHFEIMTTDLSEILKENPVIALKLRIIIKNNFKLDENGTEHVMDDEIKKIKNKFTFYRLNFL